MIDYICDVCKVKETKENTRTVVIHRRIRNVYLNKPVLNPNRKKHGTILVCVDCLKNKLYYEEKE